MKEDKAQAARPISPHLGIYRWNWTFIMSGFHRVSGFAIYFGSVIPLIWILSLALGEEYYNWVTWLYTTWFFGLPILFAYTWGVVHHTMGGIRHFVWDCCFMLEKDQRELAAKATLAASVLVTLGIWVVILGLMIFG